MSPLGRVRDPRWNKISAVTSFMHDSNNVGSMIVGFRVHGRPPLSSGRLATPGLPEPTCETLLTVLLELRSFFSLSDLS
ncbi:hypothetical protein J6590_023189 [Homalodisca vitripennis]|nr:hypothetical protein J6590_023189 [Homalodisca vitripennis]